MRLREILPLCASIALACGSARKITKSEDPGGDIRTLESVCGKIPASLSDDPSPADPIEPEIIALIERGEISSAIKLIEKVGISALKAGDYKRAYAHYVFGAGVLENLTRQENPEFYLRRLEGLQLKIATVQVRLLITKTKLRILRCYIEESAARNITIPEGYNFPLASTYAFTKRELCGDLLTTDEKIDHRSFLPTEVTKILEDDFQPISSVTKALQRIYEIAQSSEQSSGMTCILYGYALEQVEKRLRDIQRKVDDAEIQVLRRKAGDLIMQGINPERVPYFAPAFITPSPVSLEEWLERIRTGALQSNIQCRIVLAIRQEEYLECMDLPVPELLKDIERKIQEACGSPPSEMPDIESLVPQEIKESLGEIPSLESMGKIGQAITWLAREAESATRDGSLGKALTYYEYLMQKIREIQRTLALKIEADITRECPRAARNHDPLMRRLYCNSARSLWREEEGLRARARVAFEQVPAIEREFYASRKRWSECASQHIMSE